MANTPVLNLEEQNFAAKPNAYYAKVEMDDVENANFDKVDAFAGSVSASFAERLYVSGSWASHLGGATPGGPGNEYYGGLSYNPGPGTRTITKVVAVCRASGSKADAVTSIDVRKHTAPPAVDRSIFAQNAAARVNLSGSTTGHGPAQALPVSDASASWNPGEFLGAVIMASNATLESDLTVLVCWKPSASYGG